MKHIQTTDAAGHVLCHDITQIVAGGYAGARFKKGHVVTADDIPVLLSLGKDRLYVYEPDPNTLHENDAAEVLYRACASDDMRPTAVSEGKITVIAERGGLLKVDTAKLQRINALGQLIIATRHNNSVVRAGDSLAGTRIIPLTIDKAHMQQVTQLAGAEPILTLKPFRPRSIGVVVTGNEVYHKRIADTFTAVIERKLASYDLSIDQHTIVPDDTEQITQAIREQLARGAGLILCTGGMSVDPDDLTPTAMRAVGAQVVTYGVPVLPGSMLLIGHVATAQGDVPIVGLPGCVMHAPATSFDMVLPRILADDPITAEEIAALGHGGLCLKCASCYFPNCTFGKGW